MRLCYLQCGNWSHFLVVCYTISSTPKLPLLEAGSEVSVRFDQALGGEANEAAHFFLMNFGTANAKSLVGFL